MVQPSRLKSLPVFALQNVFGFCFGFAVAFGFQQLSTEPTRSY
ncbi:MULTISPECIES: hypothetical protein [Burkholderiales]|nr:MULTISPECIES: hypothetical protein [Burkholderiales]